MRAKPCRGIVGVDVECVLRQSGDRRANQLAAEGEHQPVVGQRHRPASAVAQNFVPVAVDRGHLSDDKLGTDRPKHLLERHPDIAEIGLVVAYPDRMPGVAIDHCHRDFIPGHVQFGKLARCAHRSNQAGKPRSKHDDLLHALAPTRDPKVTKTETTLSGGFTARTGRASRRGRRYG
jgi:hypothetical protein